MICTKDVKKMLCKQARMVCWKKWAAKHEHNDVKEGVWREPIQAMLRGRTNEVWTDKHRNVMKKLVVEGGWVQKRLFDIGWSDEKKCRGLKKDGTEKHTLHTQSVMEGSQTPASSRTGELGTTGKRVEGRLEKTKRYDVVPAKRRQLDEEPLVSQTLENLKNTRAGACLSKASKTKLPPRAHCWESLAGGLRVGGQLCSSIMARRWDQCVGSAVLWMLNLELTAHHQELS